MEAQEWLDYWYPKDSTCLREEEGGHQSKSNLYSKSKPISNFGKTRAQITYLAIERQLKVNYGKITGSLDLTDFPNLIRLSCSDNELISLDITKNQQLQFLHCSQNQLTELNLANNHQLTELYCSSNWLTELNLANNHQLTILHCNENQLSTLNVTNLTKLKRIICSQNQLTQLILPIPNKIKELYNPKNPQLNNDYLLSLNLETLITFQLNDSAQELLTKRKYSWEGTIVYSRKLLNVTNQISTIALLRRYQRANKTKFLQGEKERLSGQLKELEEQLNELKELRSNLEKRNEHLEILIAESEFQILEQKKQITQSYLNKFTSEEETCCKQLIKLHEEWFNANQEENYDLATKLFDDLVKLRNQLKDSLGNKFNSLMEMVLSKFNNLYQLKSQLDNQTKEKESIPQTNYLINEAIEKLEKGIEEIKISIDKKEPITIQYEKLNLINSIISQGQVLIKGNYAPMIQNSSIELNEDYSTTQDQFVELFETSSLN